jgi:glyoxylate/hydroxypyruvate reductase A
MALLFISDIDDPVEWAAALNTLDPEIELRAWPDSGPLQAIDTALVWKPPAGLLKRFPNLRLIQSLAAGIDHVLSDPELPPNVPVARLVDPDLTGQMIEFATLAVLSRHRHVERYRRQQAERRWLLHGPTDTGHCRVGVMGLGVIGGAVARALAAMRFATAGWSRTPRTVDGIETFAGAGQFGAFLARTEILVCLLPITTQTENILNAGLFERLPRGAYLVNLGRGRHLVESDLRVALESGQLGGAWLDVFRTEPLPGDHPFWSHPAITVTPHVAGWTIPRSAAAQVVENMQRVKAGFSPRNLVERGRGY